MWRLAVGGLLLGTPANVAAWNGALSQLRPFLKAGRMEASIAARGLVWVGVLRSVSAGRGVRSLRFSPSRLRQLGHSRSGALAVRDFYRTGRSRPRVCPDDSRRHSLGVGRAGRMRYRVLLSPRNHRRGFLYFLVLRKFPLHRALYGHGPHPGYSPGRLRRSRLGDSLHALEPAPRRSGIGHATQALGGLGMTATVAWFVWHAFQSPDRA